MSRSMSYLLALGIAAVMAGAAGDVAYAQHVVGSDIWYRKFRGPDEAADYVQSGGIRDVASPATGDVTTGGGGGPPSALDGGGRVRGDTGLSSDKKRGSGRSTDDDRFKSRGD